MNISERVEAILKHDVASRSSDRRLLLIYVQKAGLNLSPEQIEVFNSLPAFETIRRTRQSIQEQGKYQASVEVEASRKAKQVYMKRGGFKQPETVLEKNVQSIFLEPSNSVPEKKFVRQPLPWNES